MEDYKKIYRDFISEYIKDHSPFKIREQVRVRMFHSQKEYEITRIVVDSEGDFNYEVTSPRSYSTLPTLFKAKNLEKNG